MKIDRKRSFPGQDLIEFAITLPIFMVLVFGFIDLGRAAYYFSALQNGARESARYAIVTPGITEVGIETMVQNRLIGLNMNDVAVLPLIWTDDIVTVTLQFSFQPVNPILSSVFPGGLISMESSSTMLREQW